MGRKEPFIKQISLNFPIEGSIVFALQTDPVRGQLHFYFAKTVIFRSRRPSEAGVGMETAAKTVVLFPGSGTACPIYSVQFKTIVYEYYGQQS